MRRVCLPIVLCPLPSRIAVAVAAEQIITSRPLGSLGGQTNRMQAGAGRESERERSFRRSVARSLAHDSRTFPAVLTNDPTYYWATTATDAGLFLPPSRSEPVPTPHECGAIVARSSGRTHQAPRQSVSQPLNQSGPGARPGQAGPLSKLSAGSERRPRRPPFRPHVPPQSTGRGTQRSQTSGFPAPVLSHYLRQVFVVERRLRCRGVSCSQVSPKTCIASNCGVPRCSFSMTALHQKRLSVIRGFFRFCGMETLRNHCDSGRSAHSWPHSSSTSSTNTTAARHYVSKLYSSKQLPVPVSKSTVGRMPVPRAVCVLVYKTQTVTRMAWGRQRSKLRIRFEWDGVAHQCS